MSENIDVVMVEAGKPAAMATIGSDLESLHEEGKLSGMPLNRAVKDENGEVMDIIAGKFFICGLGEEDFASIPQELQDKYLKMFEKPETFLKIGHKVFAVPTETAKAAPHKANAHEER
jgi:hypothetical protein